MTRSRYLLIAVTGFVALIAQTIWYRYASQILGQSSLTVAAVVALALAGLAIGSWWGGRQSARSAGTYLIGMGVAVLLAQLFFSWLPFIEPALSGASALWTPLWTPLWTLLVASPLLPINFFAGAVFPQLLVSEKQTSIVGRLSAAETLGGCFGAVFAGCFAMQTFGLSVTFNAAGLLALMIGMQARPRDITDANPAPVTKIEFRMMAAIATAGLATLGMEIVWQRLLILIVGTDSYSYTIVVTSYLLGIAIGAAAGAIWLRRKTEVEPATKLARVAGLQVVAAIISLLVLSLIIRLASGPGQAWANEPVLGYELPLLKRFLLCSGLLMIPTSIQGAIFPLVVDAVSDSQNRLANPTSKIYATLAVGNVVGILICGFFLIPAAGLQQSVVILAITSAAAAWLLASQRITRSLVLLTLILIVLCGHRRNQNQSIGLAINPAVTEQLYYREGPANTVAVLAEKANPKFRRMTVDGIVIGQSGKNAEEKQLMLAHLPALLNHKTHPMKKVAVIGLGSGILSGEAAAIPGVESVTTVELSPAVIEASAQFADLLPNGAAAKMQTIQADGIHWLSQPAGSQERFDAIISDGKSRPGHIGNAAFFSSEYYQSAAGRLTPHGKFVQWFSLDAALSETKTVLKTFAHSFPNAVMAIAAPDSIYLVGSQQRIKMKQKNADTYLTRPFSEPLRNYHWNSADDLRLMGWIELNPQSSQLSIESINSLERPILERYSFDVRPTTLTANKIQNLRWLKDFVDLHEAHSGLFTDTQGSSFDDLASVAAGIDTFLIASIGEKNWLDRAASKFMLALENLPQLHRGALLANSYFVAAELAAGQADRQSEIAMLTRAGRLCPANYSMQLRVGHRLLELNDVESALPHFLNAIEVHPASGPANRGAATALIKMQKLDSALSYFQTAIADPKIRFDAEFMKLEQVFRNAKPETSMSAPETGDELLERMRQLIQQAPGQ